MCQHLECASWCMARVGTGMELHPFTCMSWSHSLAPVPARTPKHGCSRALGAPQFLSGKKKHNVLSVFDCSWLNHWIWDLRIERTNGISENKKRECGDLPQVAVVVAGRVDTSPSHILSPDSFPPPQCLGGGGLGGLEGTASTGTLPPQFLSNLHPPEMPYSK